MSFSDRFVRPFAAAPAGGVPSRESLDRPAVLDAARAALQAADALTAEHSDDVVVLADAIAERLGWGAAERTRLAAAAALHDIGKIRMPREVLTKPGPLDDREWSIVRTHTVEGQRLLDDVPGMTDVAVVVRHSHERYDGTGYPDGLRGNEIPLASRIVFCADAYHAIRSDRPYRRGTTAARALREVRAQSGTQFDPRVVAALDTAAADVRRRRVITGTTRHRRLVTLLSALTICASGTAWAVDAPVGRWIQDTVPFIGSARPADAGPERAQPQRDEPPARADRSRSRTDRRAVAAAPAPRRSSAARASGTTLAPAPGGPRRRSTARGSASASTSVTMGTDTPGSPPASSAPSSPPAAPSGSPQTPAAGPAEPQDDRPDEDDDRDDDGPDRDSGRENAGSERDDDRPDSDDDRDDDRSDSDDDSEADRHGREGHGADRPGRGDDRPGGDRRQDDGARSDRRARREGRRRLAALVRLMRRIQRSSRDAERLQRQVERLLGRGRGRPLRPEQVRRLIARALELQRRRSQQLLIDRDG